MSLNLEETDFPTLYQIADESSLSGQRKYLLFFKLEQYALITGAVTSLFPLDNNLYGSLLAILSAVSFAIAIAITAYMNSIKLENKWYIGRAIAESIKTLTWRYITKGEPFVSSKSEEEVDKHFCEILKEILKENGDKLDLTSLKQNNGFQVSDKMREIRNKTFNERKDFYLKFRIQNQLDWYNRKAIFNKKQGQKYFWVLISCQFFAFVYSLFLINNHKIFNVVPLIPTIAASLISWTQVKQFDELSQAYATTAQDISLIKAQVNYLNEEKKFDSFIADSENAFSREHTLWLARKDVYNYKSK